VIKENFKDSIWKWRLKENQKGTVKQPSKFQREGAASSYLYPGLMDEGSEKFLGLARAIPPRAELRGAVAFDKGAWPPHLARDCGSQELDTAQLLSFSVFLLVPSNSWGQPQQNLDGK
jgi:hypothetical protein